MHRLWASFVGSASVETCCTAAVTQSWVLLGADAMYVKESWSCWSGASDGNPQLRLERLATAQPTPTGCCGWVCASARPDWPVTETTMPPSEAADPTFLTVTGRLIVPFGTISVGWEPSPTIARSTDDPSEPPSAATFG